jgi:hypothetical protein
MEFLLDISLPSWITRRESVFTLSRSDARDPELARVAGRALGRPFWTRS